MKLCIYIDGANFSYGLRSLGYTDFRFDFERFIRDKILRDSNHILVSVYYYNASLKQKENPLKFREQQKLFSRLRNISNFKVTLCKRQKNPDGKIKGDDVHLALDMLREGIKNVYDEAILFSSDGDFIPLIKYVEEEEKVVTLYYFKDLVSNELLKNSKRNVLFTKSKLKRYKLRVT